MNKAFLVAARDRIVAAIKVRNQCSSVIFQKLLNDGSLPGFRKAKDNMSAVS